MLYYIMLYYIIYSIYLFIYLFTACPVTSSNTTCVK